MSFRKVAEERAGQLVARWRTVWGDWVDHWSRYCPGKSAAKVHADVPGLCTRLRLAREIADEIEAALMDQELGLDQAIDRKEKPMATKKANGAGSARWQFLKNRADRAMAEMAEAELKLKKVELKRAEVALKMDEARLKNFLKEARMK